MFNKILKAYGLKRVKRICDCGADRWCDKCLISKINPAGTTLITGYSANGSDAVKLI